jgi:hypothetical protein
MKGPGIVPGSPQSTVFDLHMRLIEGSASGSICKTFQTVENGKTRQARYRV